MAEPRAIHPVLMLGLIAMPAVFVWLLFWPGYARSTRIAALSYAFGPALIVLATGLIALGVQALLALP